MVPSWSWISASALVFTLATTLVDAKDDYGRGRGNMAHRPMALRIETTGDDVVTHRRNGTQLAPYNTTYYFDQLIDHTNPSLGTFKQRYWMNYEFYEPGGPMVLYNPGEGNAESALGYLTNRSLPGQVAQNLNGTNIVIEHRFFGLSNPYPDLSVKSLKVLTIQQAIDDYEYFVKNVNLPMPGGDAVKHGQAPWLLFGGSYSGALTSFTMINKPGLFQAGYASSAVVESIVDFWRIYQPIIEYMPKNCSADVQAVVKHVDAAYHSGNKQEMDSIKTLFNLTALEYFDDVAYTLRLPLEEWQELQPNADNGKFWEFCNALEVKDGVSAGPEGWGLDHALQAWATFWKTTYYDYYCEDLDFQTCLGSHDASLPFWTNTTVDNADRSWAWVVCNEVGFFQPGPPKGHPPIATRIEGPNYDARWCLNFFPELYAEGQSPAPNVDATNKAYQGWFVQAKHLFFANGRRDPWREATLAASGRNYQSTPDQPMAVSDGFHASDLSTAIGKVDPSILAVQQQALKAIAGWVAEWEPSA
ncbi:peptidase S28 [Trametes elegans]|nr:peptidase S28 [Trametes elegans]